MEFEGGQCEWPINRSVFEFSIVQNFLEARAYAPVLDRGQPDHHRRLIFLRAPSGDVRVVQLFSR